MKKQSRENQDVCGKRIGAGRKLGTLDRTTKKHEAEIDKIAASGGTPLDYMLQVMRDEENDLATRLDAAVRAALYVHKMLAALDHTHSGPDGGSVQAVYLISDRPMTEEEWEKERARRVRNGSGDGD